MSRHFWYCDEVLRVLKGFVCFADLNVSSLCFFSQRMSVGQKLLKLWGGEKCDKLSKGTLAT